VNIFKKSPLLKKVLSDQTTEFVRLLSKYYTIFSISSLLEVIPGGKLGFGWFLFPCSKIISFRA